MRDDGRQFNQLREIKAEREFIPSAEGSCFIQWGQTKVICTASVDKNVPLFLRGSGKGWVSSEYTMLARSTPARINRDKVSARNMEIKRLIGRVLRSVVNLNLLGENTIWIDCDVVNADGGTRVASIVGGFIALVDCLVKLYKDSIIKKFPINEFIGAVSVGICQGNYILDLNFKEDSSASLDMNVAMKEGGGLVEVQATAEEGSFSYNEFSQLLNLATEGIRKVISWQKEVLNDIIAQGYFS